MNNFHEQARAAYKRGDFTEAIALFDRAISRTESVQILDNRAACYTKLGQLADALKDAKATIQLQREDPTGYLRAGKILIEMEKPKVALEIYTHGLKSIKHVGNGYELLKTAHKDLMDEISPPRCKDPLTVLPPEIVEMFMEYLRFRTRTRACRVSKLWCSYIRSNPKLWCDLDLSQTPCLVKSSFISRAINCGRHALKRATLEAIHDFDKSLAALVKHCPLEELEFLRVTSTTLKNLRVIHSSKTLSRLKLGASESLNRAQTHYLFEQVATTLEHLEVDSHAMHAFPFTNVCPRLRTLSLKGLNHSRDAHLGDLFDSIADQMPALQTFTCKTSGGGWIENWSDGIDLRPCSSLHTVSLELGIVCSLDGILLPSSVVNLKLPECALDRMGTRTSNGNIRSVSYLPGLKELSMPITTKGEYKTFCMILDKSILPTGEHIYSHDSQHDSQLTSLKLHVDFSRFPKESRPSYVDLFLPESLRSLETLIFRHCIDFGDNELEGIIKLLPKLKSLDVSHSRVTGIGVKCAVQSGHIEELRVNDCENMGSDAVDWARKKGVKVQRAMCWSDIDEYLWGR